MAVAVASCRRGDEERNVLKEVRRGVDEEDVSGWRKARNEDARILEAMVRKGAGRDFRVVRYNMCLVEVMRAWEV